MTAWPVPDLADVPEQPNPVKVVCSGGSISPDQRAGLWPGEPG